MRVCLKTETYLLALGKMRVHPYYFDNYTLPVKVQELHNVSGASQWSGLANVRRGNGVLVKIICAFFGFPQVAENVPVDVSIEPEGICERWVRNFDGKKFSSLLQRGVDRNEFLLVEKFGVLDFTIALVIEGNRLYFVPKGLSCCRISLPGFLIPTGRSFETEKNGKFCFNVEIILPLIGLVVSYEGNLKRT